MNQGEITNPAVRLLLVAASFVVIVAGMRAAAQILVLFFLALFLAVAVAPPLFWLRRRRVPAVLLLFLTGPVLLVGKSVNDFTGNLPAYQAAHVERTAGVTEWFRGRGFDLNGQRIFKVLDPGAAMKRVTRFLTGLAGVLTNALLTFATVIFLLLEASSFDVKLRAILKDPVTSFGYFETFLRSILAAVPDVLLALVRLGLLRLVDTESTDNRYDKDPEPHINLFCTACGRI